ncbi:MAG: molybdopterin cofactor-binding domain-containing protein, partial [Nitrososphaerota archaeon]
KAVEALRERVAGLEEKLRGRRPARVEFSGGWVLIDSERRYSLQELARLLESTGLGRQVLGVYEVPRVEPLPGTLEIPHLFYMFGVTLAEVLVNVLSGEVTVTKVVSIVDAGRVINPITFTGQVEGAVAQGIGFALMEDAKIRDGYLLTRDLSTYLIPSSKDVPEIEVIPVETEEAEGPFGAKGIGEIGIISVAPAILNAVADATGGEPNEIPLTHERLYWLLKEHGLVEQLRRAST